MRHCFVVDDVVVAGAASVAVGEVATCSIVDSVLVVLHISLIKIVPSHFWLASEGGLIC